MSLVDKAVGKNLKRFQPGDAVFGGSSGTFGEYVIAREGGSVTAKPPEVSFEKAASVPIASVTALQALRDKANVQSGQKVLVNGASGGVGTFAVQIAKALGAEVTPVIDRVYRLAEVAAAICYSEEGHARGKIIVTVPTR